MESRKEAIASAMWKTLTELKREEEELFDRAYGVSRAIADIVETWERLELGPFPEPDINYIYNAPRDFEEGTGMTERIRAILRANKDTVMTPTDVRDALVETGFSVEGRSNVMAEIHTILKRLVSKNRRIKVTEKDGAAYYGYEDPKALDEVRTRKPSMLKLGG
jgi:hypothetical protein